MLQFQCLDGGRRRLAGVAILLAVVAIALPEPAPILAGEPRGTGEPGTGEPGTPGTEGRISIGPAQNLPPVDPPVFSRDDGCTVVQTTQINGQAGIEGDNREQNPCLPGGSGNPDELIGFAFVMNGCLDGYLGEVAINFWIASIDDEFFLFIWRSFGGLPNDACGLAAYGARHLVQVDGLFSIYDLCDAHIPIANGERIFIGTVYKYLTYIFGADWYIGRNIASGFPDLGYVNLSGRHGDWVDMNTLPLGLGNRWGIVMTNLTDCGPIAVEPSAWGRVKALWR